MSIDIELIRRSWSLVEPAAAKVAAHFYGKLFADYPGVRELFPPAMDAQRDRLLGALTRVVLNLEAGPGLVDYLGQLARDHRKYGVRPEHYPAVGACLIAAMRANAVDTWRPEYSEAWAEAYQTIADVMIKAAAQDEDRAPASWIGTVVAHDMRTPEIVVFTVQADYPYPYRAGQYATLQTPHWPKIWRSYSIANAPRADNMLTFHVRVVPGGWVSTALARHMREGDSLLVGPPRGSLVLERATSPHVVLIAGGTGLAPLKAIVQESVSLPDRPLMDLFHGIRHDADAYDEADLMDLRNRHGRLRVVHAVSRDQYRGSGETAIDAVERHRVYLDGDVFVCGSTDMVRETTGRLLRMGVSAGRIHTEFSPDAPISVGV
ncbi:globin domain-containing protein [Streptosporangium subroseum]|uniref:globin domain-containing protein n=1 Tax=Streptosporangium subroseum TaxID=106412 RepID=UPI00341F849F